MEIDNLEEDDSSKSEALRKLMEKMVLATSVAKLSGSSRGIPSHRDFYFYNNFNEFKVPVREIDGKSKCMLQIIGASTNLLEKPSNFPDDGLDDNVAYNWLELVNDEIIERIEAYFDSVKGLKREEEENEWRKMRVNDGDTGENNDELTGLESKVGNMPVKGADKVGQKISFHVPTLQRPQDVYKINVNNSNEPFQHVLLQQSVDGSRFIHPLENLSVLDFIDISDDNSEPPKPPSIELTPFKFVEEVKELKRLAVKLRRVDEFAVDLEHNQYRSFQGLTCLMQISTRTEDFVIDTLKLHSQIGPHLREVFKDPSKRKVMHGANHDILWLQRDFGMYVCNMFDTGQASRVLKMERFSLEYLLHYFCGVAADKKYQNADWRVRPLPPEMIKYGREDTHYLLYIYDVMRKRLLASSAESESSDLPIVEVYKRSYDICVRLYEKEQLTDSSYLQIYGVQEADFTAQQLAVFCGLTEWRDIVARAEDESTGYVLPNRSLFEIAKQIPLTSSNLRRLLKSKNLYVERYIDSVVGVIRNSIKNATAFEDAVEQLKRRRLETAKEKILAGEESGVLGSEDQKAFKTKELQLMDSSNIPNGSNSENSSASMHGKYEPQNTGNSKARVCTKTSAKTTVQLVKMPNRAYGSILRNSVKRQLVPDKRKRENVEVEQMKASTSIRMSIRDETLQPEAKISPNKPETSCCKETVAVPALYSSAKVDEGLDDDELKRLEKSIADFAAELDEDDDDEFM